MELSGPPPSPPPAAFAERVPSAFGPDAWQLSTTTAPSATATETTSPYSLPPPSTAASPSPPSPDGEEVPPTIAEAEAVLCDAAIAAAAALRDAARRPHEGGFVTWLPQLPQRERELLQAPVLLAVETDGGNGASARYEATARTLGWDVRMLGRGAPWRGVIGKVALYDAALAALPSDALVVLSDARDVVPCRSPDGFGAQWLSFGAPIVACMEYLCDGMLDYNPHPDVGRRHCASLAAYWAAYGVSSEAGRVALPRRFVNSGLIAGRAGALQHYLAWATRGHASGRWTKDQMALGRYMEAYPRMVAADVHAALLHTSNSGCYGGLVDPRQAGDAPTMHELLGRGAWLLHVPGINVPEHALQRVTYELAAQFTDAIARAGVQKTPSIPAPLIPGQPHLRINRQPLPRVKPSIAAAAAGAAASSASLSPPQHADTIAHVAAAERV